MSSIRPEKSFFVLWNGSTERKSWIALDAEWPVYSWLQTMPGMSVCKGPKQAQAKHTILSVGSADMCLSSRRADACWGGRRHGGAGVHAARPAGRRQPGHVPSPAHRQCDAGARRPSSTPDRILVYRFAQHGKSACSPSTSASTDMTVLIVVKISKSCIRPLLASVLSYALS